MEILDSPAALAAWADARRRTGTIGLVPTMGYLHAGHASLIAALRPVCDHLVVSIFVNPLQFGANEDLATYPRDREGDLRTCAAHGADAVFVPTAMYPEGFATTVTVSGLTEGLCGASRPTHFAGVATVVTRLWGLSRCDVSIFGEKDFQQLAVLRRLAEDLGLPVAVRGGPIVREPDGLAMSSRNKYLSEADRARAASLSASLRAMQAAAAQGERDVAALVAIGRSTLHVDREDYLSVVDAGTLAPVQTLGGRAARALVAAWLGSTRLIDNVAIGEGT